MKKIVTLMLAALLVLGLAAGASAISFSVGYVPLGVYSDPDFGVYYDLTAWTIQADQPLTDRFSLGLEAISGNTAPIDYSIQLVELYGKYNFYQAGNFSVGLVASYAWSDLHFGLEYQAQSIYTGVGFGLALTERFSVNGVYKMAIWSNQDADEFYPRVRSMAKLNFQYEVAPGLTLSAGYVYYQHCYVEPHFTYDGYQVGLTWSL